MHKLWRNIDTFCDQYQWNDQSRVLLSLAALNAHSLMNNQIEHFMQRAKAFGLLEQIREQQQQQTAVVDLTKNGDDKKHRYIPCILIVDERLDHFYWEEINICQEFTRASSLQSPWRLYYYYRENIEHGYVKVSITDGVCVINPDKSLPRMKMHMSTFFDYWLPHWKKTVDRKPTNEEFFKDLLIRSCHVYVGCFYHCKIIDSEVEMTSWIKQAATHSSKCNKNSRNIAPSTSSSTGYNMGSLRAVLARVHQRNDESELYNTVPYVCRGLSVWNCHIEPLTFN
ncbi:LOW QUALITY PROTEIN: extra spindle pole bodies like 1, separase [Glossina fuscipes fuscipes]